MKLIQAINRVLLKLLDAVSITLMVAMVVFLFIQLIARFVFNYGFSWTEESAKLCLIMLAYIGAAMTSVNGVHVNITILNDLLKGAAQKILFLFQQAAAIFFLVLVALFSVPAIETASKSVTTNTHINNGLIYAVVPIACIIMILGHMAKIVRQCTASGYVAAEDEDRAAEKRPRGAGGEEGKP